MGRWAGAAGGCRRPFRWSSSRVPVAVAPAAVVPVVPAVPVLPVSAAVLSPPTWLSIRPHTCHVGRGGVGAVVDADPRRGARGMDESDRAAVASCRACRDCCLWPEFARRRWDAGRARPEFVGDRSAGQNGSSRKFHICHDLVILAGDSRCRVRVMLGL